VIAPTAACFHIGRARDYTPQPDDSPRKRNTMKTLPKAELERVREGFDFADRDQNGLLDFEEFSGLLKVLAPDATVQQAAEGFSIVDTNSDGQIDYDEFLAWWRLVWWEF
jgi:hypothetical protein